MKYLKITGAIIGVIALILAINLLIAFPVMWMGNRMLVDVGLDRAEYWSWYWFVVVFTLFLTSSNSSKRSYR